MACTIGPSTPMTITKLKRATCSPGLHPRKLGIAAISLLAFGSCAFGAPVSMQLTSPGNNGLGGVYVAPYYASIDGGTAFAVICDDYADESWVGAPSWNANVINVASLQGEATPNTLVMFDKNPNTPAEASKQQKEYAE